MKGDLFAAETPFCRLGPGTVLLPGFALERAASLLAGIVRVLAVAALRQMRTPGGRPLSVTMSNCGEFGWVSDAGGYRYQRTDPLNGAPWPAMPEGFRELAGLAAARAGFPDFSPQACLINSYLPGARMGLHQDRDERDLTAPIVSVSLGLPAEFLLGGLLRGERTARLPLAHGDVLVWGGPDRLRFHGVRPLAAGNHPEVGARRFNLTFRRVS